MAGSFHCWWKKAVRLKPLYMYTSLLWCGALANLFCQNWKMNGNMSLGSGIGFQDVHLVSDQKSPNMTCHDYAIIMVILNCKDALGDVQNIHRYTKWMKKILSLELHVQCAFKVAEGWDKCMGIGRSSYIMQNYS